MQVEPRLEHLPPELLGKIVSQLDTTKSMATFLFLTSGTIRKVWPIILAHIGSKSLSAIVSALFNHSKNADWNAFFAHLGTTSFANIPLHLAMRSDTGVERLTTLQARFSPLQGLSVDFAALKVNQLQAHLGAANSLQELHLLRYGKISEAEFVQLPFPPSLKKFSIQLWGNQETLCCFNSRELNHLLTKCPDLSDLEARDNPKDKNPRLTRMDRTQWPTRLHTVRFPQWTVTQNELAHLVTKCANLRLVEDTKGNRLAAPTRTKTEEKSAPFLFSDPSLLSA